ncbi:cytochrome P450 9e2-like [Nylanderia fulva]|uniref:cytochrome P450 9e2-like n=1 Tax=Nylanderia fulva TaxID=613905 RepID=UPI0010FBA00D|nr:cytochrome P450 9e2-like [Nylanderia fulva]
MVYVIILTAIVGALGLYYYFFKNLIYFKKHGVPYKTPLPILGNMGPSIFRLQSIADLVKNTYDLHPEAKYVGLFDMIGPLIVIRDRDLIKSIVLKNFDLFPDRRTFIEAHQDPLFGKNLFALKEERWRQERPLLTPAFTSSKMKSMFKLMSEYGAEFSNNLTQLPAEKRKVMDIKDAFTRYTNDVIATCAFGITVDSMRNPKNEFYVYGKEATNFNNVAFIKMYMYRILPWLAQILKLRIVREQIANFFQDLVETTIKIRDEKGIVRPDMLQLMMESRGKEGKELSTEDMVCQAFLFFFGGFDTTSTLMCFAAHEIAVNMEIQKKLQNEMDQVLEESNGQAPYEMVNNMEYLDAVINEALRRYPIASSLERVCMKEFELPPTLPGRKPITIKKGDTIWIPVYGLHHDPQYFEEPEKFDPERFLGERKKESLNSGAYLPFGLGPRMCIGNRFALMETKVLLFHLLARCDLKTCEKTPSPLKLANDGFNMRPEGGFWLNVSPRENINHTVTVNKTCQI